MMKPGLVRKAVSFLTLLGTAGGAQAAAFQLAEVSTSGLGRAYAGEAAIGDNATALATNPALMSRFDKTEFSLGGIYADSKIHLSGPVTVSSSALGTLARGNASHRNIVPGALIPNFYIVHPINDRFAVGGGVNVNFGLKSDFDDDYDAGIFGGRTDLTAINMNLSGSYRISRGWSFGAGVNVLYAQAEIKRNAGILADLTGNQRLLSAVRTNAALASRLSAALPALSAVTPESQMVHLEGDAWGVGWNAGLLYEFNERNRMGLAYHSPIDLDFKDNSAFSRNPSLLGHSGVGRLTLKLPAYWEFSGFHQMTDKFAMHYSVKYTQWRRFKELRGVFDDGAVAFDKKESYRNNTRIALGATYTLNERWTLRAGIAYDETAANGHASASIPDADRTWYSLGVTYHFTPDFSVDLGYAHLVGSHTGFKETQSVGGLLVVEADYATRSRADLYGLNINYRF